MPVIVEQTSKTPSPRLITRNFNNLLHSNQNARPDNLQVSKRTVDQNDWEVLKFGSDIKNSDEDFKPKSSTSPNFRYKQNDTNTAVSSNDNKIFVNDDLKLSNVGSAVEERLTSAKKTFSSDSSKINRSNKEDSICEYNEFEMSPQINFPRRPRIEETALFKLRLEETEHSTWVQTPKKNEERKDIFVHPKFELIASQLPLYSISEDVNSPYFASSNSNIEPYFKKQGTPNKDGTDYKKDWTISNNNTEYQDNDISGDRQVWSGTIQTTTSLSENFFENANLDKLEQKLSQVIIKRTKRIELFENYLEEWEKKRQKELDNPVWKIERRAKPKTANCSPAKRTKKLAPNINLYIRSSHIFKTKEPVLSSRQTHRRRNTLASLQ